jgi:hypothetical protein
MRLPRVRFTVRRMMVATAVLAISCFSEIWLARMGRLAGIYEQRALYHAQQERATRQAIDDQLAHIQRIVRYPEKDPVYLHLQQLQDKSPSADYHAAMSGKYELASRRPWQPVTPDPPPP